MYQRSKKKSSYKEKQGHFRISGERWRQRKKSGAKYGQIELIESTGTLYGRGSFPPFCFREAAEAAGGVRSWNRNPLRLKAPETGATPGEPGVLSTPADNKQQDRERERRRALTELGGDDGDVVPGVLLAVQLPQDVHRAVARVDVEHSLQVGVPIDGVPAQRRRRL